MDYDAADTGEQREPDFEEWYRTSGYKLFSGNKKTAQQWYRQRKRGTKPKVATMDLMKKAMG